MFVIVKYTCSQIKLAAFKHSQPFAVHHIKDLKNTDFKFILVRRHTFYGNFAKRIRSRNFC
jgi:hypothetical protein